MLGGENIICFAKDWSEDPTSNNHVMRELARVNRVLWLNSIATRTPVLSSSGDRGKVVRKLASLTRGPELVAENLWVHTPLVLPMPYSRRAALLNRWLLRRSIDQARRKLGMDSFQLWSFLPTAAPYLGQLGESMSVYYCVDEWSQTAGVDQTRIAELEQAICERANLVFTTSRELYERKRVWNAETHLAPHGVDHPHFAAALADDLARPEELAAIGGPILGFFGGVNERVDLDLLTHLAERRPDWTIVVIGKISVDVSRLRRLPNVRILGRRPYAALPAYCKAFSVGLIPYLLTPLTRSISPIKLREYLSAGLPVVATPLPDLAAWTEHCSIAATHPEYERAVDRALREDTIDRRRTRSQALRNETWERRVASLGEQVARVRASRA